MESESAIDTYSDIYSFKTSALIFFFKRLYSTFVTILASIDEKLSKLLEK